MVQTRELFDSMAVQGYLTSENLAAAVEVLQDCEEAVSACAVAMLAETEPRQLLSAVSRDMDCADVVAVTRRVLTRGSGPDSTLLSAQLEACLLACEHSNELCSRHAPHHEHCRMCAQATRRCVEMCQQTLKALHT